MKLKISWWNTNSQAIARIVPWCEIRENGTIEYFEDGKTSLRLENGKNKSGVVVIEPVED